MFSQFIKSSFGPVNINQSTHSRPRARPDPATYSAGPQPTRTSHLRYAYVLCYASRLTPHAAFGFGGPRVAIRTMDTIQCPLRHAPGRGGGGDASSSSRMVVVVVVLVTATATTTTSTASSSVNYYYYVGDSKLLVLLPLLLLLPVVPAVMKKQMV